MSLGNNIFGFIGENEKSQFHSLGSKVILEGFSMKPNVF
jgi:hypothetical protein